MAKRVRRLIIFTLVILLITLVFIFPIGFAYLYIGALVDHACGNRTEPMSSRLSHTEGLQQFTFSPQKGITLDAWYAPGSNGAGIIVLPGAWGGADTMYQEMEFLHESGYSVMTYDTRSCANPPQQTSLGYTEMADLKAALDIFSRYPEVKRIGVFGHSMGGATALLTAAEDDRIQAVVATGNYADLADQVRRENGESRRNWWERYARGWIVRMYEWKTGVDMDKVSPVQAIDKISPRAVYLIHGSEELQDTYGDEQFEAARQPKHFWRVEGAGHGDYPSVDFEYYKNSIIEFFDQYLHEETR